MSFTIYDLLSLTQKEKEKKTKELTRIQKMILDKSLILFIILFL